MPKLKLQGVFPLLSTPFRHDGSLYTVKIQHNVEKQNLTSISGLIAGSAGAGESEALDGAELREVWRLSAADPAEGKLLLADCSGRGIRETASLLEAAGGYGYHAAVITLPSAYGLQATSTAGRLVYARAIADASPLPLVIRQAIASSASELCELAQNPKVAGLIVETAAMAASVVAVNREVAVLCGAEREMLGALEAGASGAAVALGSAAPYSVIAVWEAYRTREDEAGRDWAGRLTRGAEGTWGRWGIAGLKYAMDRNGYYGGAPRLPAAALPPIARPEVERAIEELKG